MVTYEVEPWPSTYKMIGETEPKKLTSKFDGRKIGAFRVALPSHTIEPPQIHLIATRDGKPFEELLTDFDRYLQIAFFDIRTGKTNITRYQPGQDIIIPEYKVHWLINRHDATLEFTCEYAPYPWDGDNDEPEFPNLKTLLQFVKEKGLMQKLIEAQ